MKNAKLTTLICGLLSMVATVIVYLLIFDDIFASSMRWVSLMVILIAECIGILKAAFARKNFITQASVFTSGVHLVVVLILSIVFVNSFPRALETYILLNVLVLCALAAIDLFLFHFGKNVSLHNKKLKQSQSVMDACYAKAQGLVAVYGQSGYKDDLVAIAELIKYSDNSELTDDEATILAKLGELETQLKDGGEGVLSLITEIKNVVNLRSIKMKGLKRGDY